jgi:energy-coupling factor transporter ATP-binding protein EcfA2
MPRKAHLPRLDVTALGPIKRASVEFGDLNVFVGPQASGKTILLETLKLVMNPGDIASDLRVQGYDWGGDANILIDLFFGEGMRSLFSQDTKIVWKGRPFSIEKFAAKPPERSRPYVHYIPAHRALVLHQGWPRHFRDYSTGDPFVVREFSDTLRIWMEDRYEQTRRAEASLAKTTRELVQSRIFGDYVLGLEHWGPRRRLVLRRDDSALPFMAWSAGQREFSPLLLGLNYMLDLTRRVGAIDDYTIIIEEPEMGLHPLAITAVLFLVLDLLDRGFQICISTHSPHVLDLLWALRVLREHSANTKQVLELFGAKGNVHNRRIAAAALEKEIRVYSFDRQSGLVDDISRLDPDSNKKAEVTWGGLVGFSTHVSDVVADVVANAGKK